MPTYEATFDKIWYDNNFAEDIKIVAPPINTSLGELFDDGWKLQVSHRTPLHYNVSKPKLTFFKTTSNGKNWYKSFNLKVSSRTLINEEIVKNIIMSNGFVIPSIPWVDHYEPKDQVGDERQFHARLTRYIINNEVEVLQLLNDHRYQAIKDFVDSPPMDEIESNIIDLVEIIKQRSVVEHPEDQLERITLNR